MADEEHDFLGGRTGDARPDREGRPREKDDEYLFVSHNAPRKVDSAPIKGAGPFSHLSLKIGLAPDAARERARFLILICSPIMPRPRRIAPGGFVYHALNRATEGQSIFHDAGDYRMFLELLRLAGRRTPMRVCGYCLMRTHWHLILWPFADGALSTYLHWVTTCHSLQYRACSDSQGRGYVYQGRFCSFPVQTSRYYYNALKYVEGNALRSHYVQRAEDWPWSSLVERSRAGDLLDPGPLEIPCDWTEIVNTLPPEEQLEELRASVRSGRPYGSPSWSDDTAAALALGQTLRCRGRPRK